jgi:hypothetical protein
MASPVKMVVPEVTLVLAHTADELTFAMLLSVLCFAICSVSTY